MSISDFPRVHPRIAAVLFIFVFSTVAFAVSGVDPTFIPVPSKQVLDGKPLLQSDGKLLVVGGWNAVEGKAKGMVYRLNGDGTLDNTFSFCSCVISVLAGRPMLTPDDKLLLAGSDRSGFPKIIRLLTDGSIDPTFNSADVSAGSWSGEYTLAGVQSDGKVLALRYRVVQPNGNTPEYRLYRLNTDGSTESTLMIFGTTFGHTVDVTGYKQLSDGRYFLSYNSNNFSLSIYNPTVRLFNANGTFDKSFSAPVFAGGGSRVNGIVVLSDNSVIAMGQFDTVNGVAKPDAARILPAGNVDLTYTAASADWFSDVKSLPGDKVLAGGIASSQGVLRRYNADGTLDGTFTTSEVVYPFKGFDVEPTGRVYVQGETPFSQSYMRLEASGSRDATYNPNASSTTTVSLVAPRGDGKVYLAGDIDQVNGVVKNGLARVNSDGSLDATFDPGTGFDQDPTEIIAQPDGRLLAIGFFTTYNGASRPRIARINNDGTLDTTFAPTVTGTGFPILGAIALQTDGKIIIGGTFTTVNGVSKERIARLNGDGTLDTSFNSLVAGLEVKAIAVLPDGKIMIGGQFTGVDGFIQANFARLNPNGSFDNTVSGGGSSTVSQLFVQPSGKILLLSGSTITRRTATGAADVTFPSPTFDTSSAIRRILMTSDGSILIGGLFNRINNVARPNIARLSPDGILDLTFLRDGADGWVLALAMGPSNKLFVGGGFNFFGGQLRAGIAAVNYEPYRKNMPFDFDGDGRADFAVMRPSQNYWYLFRSSDSIVTAASFGLAGDESVPADYDGDGKTDIAIFRPASGDWWYISSATGIQNGAHWGQNGDVPMPSDFDGDGRADYIVYRPGNKMWYRYGTATGGQSAVQFGAGDDKPLIGDFDGDGKTEPAIYRPSTGDWWWQSSIDNVQRSVHWGIAEDVPAPADFDGDGKTDFAVFRPSNGVWYVINSGNLSFTFAQFGLPEDLPVPADYDGDGKSDIAVFRPSSGVWYMLRSTSGFGAMQFGAQGDVPAPNSFIH